MINPDDEIEARWKEFTIDTWVNDPRTKGLKKGIFALNELCDRLSDMFSDFESYEWIAYDYVDSVREKEPPPKPIRKPYVHNKYNGKQNYASHNQKRNFNQRRR